jgi:putative transposase
MDMPNEPPSLSHSSSLRLHRRMTDPGTWFITKCLHPRRPLLKGDVAQVIADALAFHATHGNIILAAFCVMPDHWHGLFSPVEPRALPTFMRHLDHWVSTHTGAALAAAGCAWQDGYQDTRTRSTKQFHYVCSYIHMNPVEKGLVGSAEKWPWSTANGAYACCSAVPWPWRFEQDGLLDDEVPW